MKDSRGEQRSARGSRAGELHRAFRAVRSQSEELARGLQPEDQTVQSMPDCSPTKWHLAHVSWFFETFLLVPHQKSYEVAHPQFPFLFNSYYEAAGPRHNRFERGLITRPTVAEVADYRDHVNRAMNDLIHGADERLWAQIEPIVEIGIHHEQQHQELILMDILNLFAANPLRPAYRPWKARVARASEPLKWFDHPGGVFEIGHDGRGFSYDNESPRHEVAAPPVPPRLAGGDECRVDRLHRGRRLCAPGSLARRRLGAGQERRVLRAATTGKRPAKAGRR